MYTITLVYNSLLFAQTSVTREYQIKAAFLFNFTQFVEWPATSNSQAPIVIGVLGKNPFGSYLEDIVSGEKVNGHSLVVQYYNSVEDIKTCHVLFVSTAEANNFDHIVETLKNRNILTVSDGTDFIHHGGMIRFFTRNNKIQLQINPEAAKSAKLVVSSKLLRLAEIYSP